MKQQGKQQDTAQKFQMEQQKAQLNAAHEAVQAQADIQVAQIKAELDKQSKLLDAFLKAAGQHQQMVHAEREENRGEE